MSDTPIFDEALEAHSNQPTIVREVNIGDAVYALTEQNAIFRNGRQMVIPHVGVDFLPELMAALTTEDFVAGIVENVNRGKRAGDCGHFSSDVFAKCNAPEGHEGPHTYTNENGGVTAWHDHPTLEEIEALPTGKDRCDAIQPDTGVHCDKPFQHEGPHQGWQGGPADWGGGGRTHSGPSGSSGTSTTGGSGPPRPS